MNSSSTSKGVIYKLNGQEVDPHSLSPEGREALELFSESEVEIKRLETSLKLLRASQRDLLRTLDPLLKEIQVQQGKTQQSTRVDEPSMDPPSTPADPLVEKAPSVIDIIPESLRAK